MIKNKNGLALLLCLTLCVNGIVSAQKSDTVAVYSNYSQYKNTLPPHQIVTYLILKADSTFEWIDYTGEINDDKKKYLSWKKDESSGVWKKNKKIITLIRGNVSCQFIASNKYIKPKRFQNKSTGFSVKYKKWIFERRTKYKLVFKQDKEQPQR